MQIAALTNRHLREFSSFCRWEKGCSGDLGKSSKIRHLINGEAEVSTRPGHLQSLCSFHQASVFLKDTDIGCFCSQQQFCLSRSLWRQIGCPKNESQTFLIKYLLSNCSLKYEIENGNADEDEMSSGGSLSWIWEWWLVNPVLGRNKELVCLFPIIHLLLKRQTNLTWERSN